MVLNSPSIEVSLPHIFHPLHFLTCMSCINKTSSVDDDHFAFEFPSCSSSLNSIMLYYFTTKSVKSRGRLSLFLKQWQFEPAVRLNVKLIIDPTVNDWTIYNSKLVETSHCTIRQQITEIVGLLRRQGYNVIVEVKLQEF